MKKILTYCIFSAAVMFSSVALAAGSDPYYRGAVRITSDSLTLKGDSLNISLRIAVEKLAVPSNQSLILTPVLQGTTRSLDLPSVMINGRKRDQQYRRTLAIDRKRERPAPYMAVSTNKYSGSFLSYSVTIPFAEWMDASILRLKEEMYGCSGVVRLISVEPLARLDIKPEPEPVVVVEEPVVEPPKVIDTVVYRKEGAAFLDFPVAQSRILPDFKNNAVELWRVNSSLDSLFSNKGIKITAIYITGYASPEGGYELNRRLSQERAEAFANYLQMRHGRAPGLYRIEWGGEDWYGLASLVEKSYIPQKELILGIIRSGESTEARKQRLRQLDGGVPYRYMLQNLYPQLRRAEYKVFYTVTETTEEKP